MGEEHTVESRIEATGSRLKKRADIEALESMLGSEQGQTRKDAFDSIGRIANTEPDRVTPLSDRLVDGLDDSFLVARMSAVDALSTLAEHRPDAVSHGTAELVGLLEEDPPSLRSRAARAVERLVDADPTLFVAHADELFEVLHDGPRVQTGTESLLTGDDPSLEEQKAVRRIRQNRGQALSNDKQRSVSVRRVASESLSSIARVEPESCSLHVADCVALFEDDQPRVRGEAIEVVRHVAEWDPDAVEEAIDPLTGRLRDEAVFVRARAIRALGFAEAAEAVPQLEGIAAAESTDSVAELATVTAEWLETRA